MRQRIQFIEVAGIPGQMNRHDRLGKPGDFRSHRFHIQISGVRLHIGKNRDAALIENRVIGRDKRDWSGDYLGLLVFS